MKEITKIETITIILDEENDGMAVVFNGEPRTEDDGTTFKVPMDNAIHAARALTKTALWLWDGVDRDYIEVLERSMAGKVKKVCDQWKGLDRDKFVSRIRQLAEVREQSEK